MDGMDEGGGGRGPRKDAPHLSAEARPVLDWEPAARVEYTLKDHWIGHAEASQAMKAMGELLRRPHTTTSPSLLLLGRPGNGKTTILERFVKLNPATTRSTGDLTSSVIAMSMPPGGSETEFWTEVLLACGVAHRVTDPLLLKKTQAYSVLEAMKPRVLVGDELNNLMLGTGAAQRMIMARLRELTNKLRIHLVFAGTEETANAVDVDKQLNRRLEQHELSKWRLDAGLQRLLRSFESFLPLPAPSGLGGEAMASEIFGRTDGTIGGIAHSVKEAAKLAIEGGRERIDIEAIRAVRLDTPEERRRRAKRL